MSSTNPFNEFDFGHWTWRIISSVHAYYIAPIIVGVVIFAVQMGLPSIDQANPNNSRKRHGKPTEDQYFSEHLPLHDYKLYQMFTTDPESFRRTFLNNRIFVHGYPRDLAANWLNIRCENQGEASNPGTPIIVRCEFPTFYGPLRGDRKVIVSGVCSAVEPSRVLLTNCKLEVEEDDTTLYEDEWPIADDLIIVPLQGTQ